MEHWIAHPLADINDYSSSENYIGLYLLFHKISLYILSFQLIYGNDRFLLGITFPFLWFSMPNYLYTKEHLVQLIPLQLHIMTVTCFNEVLPQVCRLHHKKEG